MIGSKSGNPRTVPIIEQTENYQLELCDLQNDISLKSWPESGIELYKILNKEKYPQLRNFGLKIFSMFGSTYLCESSFSKMKHIKSGAWSSLNDTSLSSLMRVNASKLDVDISLLKATKYK
ncbi:General transcription factor II-I repeat domain-containing protein 2A [Ooceraea biroi]|uniref:General transcription factor II-I repeat domain-containing protein 2A n=1 Tax=Ooceraea biroi TaxID=2015173 RepID=A0A026VUR4_OOCBI|nr:General transcription factor II-I repeat domain-containing protein 2A [Ooceraea biroi]